MVIKDKCNIMFFDSEYTAETAIARGMQEMIQCALLVCEACVIDDRAVFIADEPLYTYKTFVKPVYSPILSSYIKDLTGISQKDVDEGILLKEVLSDIYDITVRYNVHRAFTWGPDKIMLKRNLWVIEHNRQHAEALLSVMYDVSGSVSQAYGYETTISQQKMGKILGIEELGVKHDAFCDAFNLYRILKKYVSEEIDTPLMI